MAEEIKIDPESLKRFIPLNTLSDEGMALLLPHVEIFTAQKGTELFQRGDEKRLHFYLLSGRVILEDDEGDEDLVQAGSVQAKFPIGHKFPRKVNARAGDKIQFLRIDSRRLDQAQSPETAQDSGISDSGLSGDSIIIDEPGAEDDDWMSQLLRSRVFQLIPPGNSQRVMMCMEEFEVKKGDVVIRQGEEGDYFYLINRGHCRVDRDMGDGKPPVELARLGPGVSFGEDALLAGNKRSATITMLADGRLLRLSKKNFVELIKEPVTKPFGFKQAKAKVDEGATWLDVREAAEFAKGHLRGAINLPFSQLRFQADSLDPNSHYVVCCQDGRSSHAASYLLASRGIQATVLDKGLQMVPGTEFGQGGDEIEETADPAAAASCGDAAQLQALVEKLQQQVARLEQDKREREEKRVAEISALHDALEQARKEHSQVLTELLDLKKSSNQEEATSSEELQQARREIDELKHSLTKVRHALEEARGEQSQGDEALREQVKGYLEEKLLLEQEVIELRKAMKAGAKPGGGNRALEEAVDRLRKELAQAELALDAEISSRQELEEELEQLKAAIEH
ncbi:MAG: cyclic nucleotide-binding domain-containing protein [Gammaproteobacteria bacterium]|nr:cyclic nucleotide-binding domain-containing protein [Gammaproteobacteria bacterium]